MSTTTHYGMKSIDKMVAQAVFVCVIIFSIGLLAYKMTVPDHMTRTVCSVRVTDTGTYVLGLADGSTLSLSHGKDLKPGVTYVFETKWFSDPLAVRKAEKQEEGSCAFLPQ